MVTIVKRGTGDLANCVDCGSILRYTPRDVWKEDSPSLGDFEGDVNYFIRCPCGSAIRVSENISPNRAREIEAIEKERQLSEYDV